VARLGRQADRETREFVVDVHVLELPKKRSSNTTSAASP
jgi:hypothetical protein